MTVDAFFTWAAGVREDECVKYVETGPPERVVIDLDVLASAPESLRDGRDLRPSVDRNG